MTKSKKSSASSSREGSKSVATRIVRRKFKAKSGGGTIAELKRWIEHDFGRKFSRIARIVDRPRRAITFKMWGPTMVFTVSAWEVGGSPFGSPHHDLSGDGIMASCSQRYFQDGEDWHRGNDMTDGLLDKKTWDRLSAEIRYMAIQTLPTLKESHWRLMNKGTTRDMVRAGVKLKLTPTLKGAAEARKRKKAKKEPATKKSRMKHGVERSTVRVR